MYISGIIRNMGEIEEQGGFTKDLQSEATDHRT